MTSYANIDWSKPVKPQLTDKQLEALQRTVDYLNISEKQALADILTTVSSSTKDIQPEGAGLIEGVALSWEGLLNLPKTIYEWATGNEGYEEVDLTPQQVEDRLAEWAEASQRILELNGYSQNEIGTYITRRLNRAKIAGIASDIVFDPVGKVVKVAGATGKVLLNLGSKAQKATTAFQTVKVGADKWRVVKRTKTGQFTASTTARVLNKTAFRVVNRSASTLSKAKAVVSVSKFRVLKRIESAAPKVLRRITTKWTKRARIRVLTEGYGRVVIKPSVWRVIHSKVSAATPTIRLPSTKFRRLGRIRTTISSARRLYYKFNFVRRVVKAPNLALVRIASKQWRRLPRSVRTTARVGGEIISFATSPFTFVTRWAFRGARSLVKLSTSRWRRVSRIKAADKGKLLSNLRKIHKSKFKMNKRLKTAKSRALIKLSSKLFKRVVRLALVDKPKPFAPIAQPLNVTPVEGASARTPQYGGILSGVPARDVGRLKKNVLGVGSQVYGPGTGSKKAKGNIT